MTTTLTIQSLGQRGEGAATLDGEAVFIPFTLPGEVLESTISGNHGTLERLIRSSPHRIAAFCPHFGVCGGCQLQHLDPKTYSAFKLGLLETALSRTGIKAPIAPLIDARGDGRRRTTLHAQKTGAGFMAARSHALHDIDHCPILVPALDNAPLIARAAYAAIGDCDVSFTASLTGLDVAISTRKRAKPERLAAIAQRFKLARLSLNGETVIQAQVPVIKLGAALVEIPATSFLQATAAAETLLADLVGAGLAPAKNIADLFCGVGPFALRLAARTKVFAADNDKAAIGALVKAHNTTRGLKAVTAQRRDLYHEPLTATELKAFDGVVFDPPRAGAEAQAHELAASTVKTVIAVSCDPKTFARDAAILITGGYRLDRVTPVDQFAFSTHLEVVGVFTR